MTGQTPVHIEATDACTLVCSGCNSPHGNNFISIEKFTVLAKKLVGHTTMIGLSWRGESCLHPKLPELAEVARKLGFRTRLATNTAIPNLGMTHYVKTLLDNLDSITMCIDGYDENTAKIYRHGASWKRIEQNLQVISKIDANCMKIMRVLMFKYNDGKEDVYRKLAKKYGIDEIIFAAPLINLEPFISTQLAEKWVSKNKKYQRYIRLDDKWSRSTGRCSPSPIVSVHGIVHPCCLDWKLEHPVGDLTKERWISIMEKQKVVKRTIRTQKMCTRCCLAGKKVDFKEKII